jgi:cobalamin-dependent methionine synthase I
LGSERIEALCDALCAEWKEDYASRGFVLRPRFSAGYGDLPLTLQNDIFESLQCSKHIGLTLCDSLLMSPTKSVTAIVGVMRKED